MSMFRTYFYDLATRKEMTDFPHNGKTWLATGGAARGDDGEFIADTTRSVTVASYASLARVNGEVTLTAADFPGKKVAVKTWFSPGNVEWRKLV